MNTETEKKIIKDYKKGLKYKELEEKYNITENQLKQVIRKSKLTRTKSKAQINNKNAEGNKGGSAPPGNKNAVITGEFENFLNDVLEDDEINILNSNENVKEKDLLFSEYKVLHIREKRMLKRIEKLKNGKDVTVKSIKVLHIKDKKNKYDGNSTEREIATESESTVDVIQRIEEGITRVQEAKRRCIETISKLEKPENPNEEGDNSFIEALNKKVGDIWNEEE